MMYQRFKRGLVKPSELALYLRDSSTWIVAYLFIVSDHDATIFCC